MIEVTLPLSLDRLDLIDEHLLEAGDARWMVLQDVILPSAKLVGVFASAEEAEAAWRQLRESGDLFGDANEPVFRVLADEDWRDAYKAHFKPWNFGRLHWVPVWERASYPIPMGDVVIWLDPGMAFGTGNHETTRLCCERLVALADPMNLAGSVLDAGCGSGILALSAARLGFKRVDGFDNDPLAVEISRENAAANGLAEEVNFFVGDLVSGLAGRTARIVLANIQADVLLRFAPNLLGAVESGGALVLSGILAREIDQVRAAYKAAAPTWRTESKSLGEWADLLLLRP